MVDVQCFTIKQTKRPTSVGNSTDYNLLETEFNLHLLSSKLLALNFSLFAYESKNLWGFGDFHNDIFGIVA